MKNTHDIEPAMAVVLDTDSFPKLNTVAKVRRQFRLELRNANKKEYSYIYNDVIKEAPEYYTQDFS